MAEESTSDDLGIWVCIRKTQLNHKFHPYIYTKILDVL